MNYTLEQYLHANVKSLQDHWVNWILLAKFAYNNSVHASTSVMPFFSEKVFQPRIDATIKAILADEFISNVTNAIAQAEKLVALQAAIEQCWKEVTTTQQQYADRRTKPCKIEVSDMVSLSG